MQHRARSVVECGTGESRSPRGRIRRMIVPWLTLGVTMVLTLSFTLASSLADLPSGVATDLTPSAWLPFVGKNVTPPIVFIEDFSTVTYQDAANTTAHWDTVGEELRLHSEIFVSEVASLPTGRDSTSAVYADPLNKAYVFGGDAGSVELDEIVEYNPGTNSVTVLAAKLPTPRKSTSAVYVPTTNKAYIFGGDEDFYDTLDEIVEYDLTTGAVTVLEVKLPSPRMDSSAIYVPSTNKAYIFGGDGAYGEPDPGRDIVEFDLATGVVTLLPETLPSERNCAPAVYVESQNAAYLFGGRGSTGIGAQIVKYDLNTRVVTLLGDTLPSPRWGASAVYVPTVNKAYVLGGYYGATFDDIVEYDVASGETTLLAASLPTAVSQMSAVYVPVSNRAYVFGGYFETRYDHMAGIAEIRFSHYVDQEQAQSLNINPGIFEVLEATLSADQILSGQTVDYYLSNNAGVTWDVVTPGVKHTFATTGADLRWKAVLKSDGSITPLVDTLFIAFTPNVDIPAPAAPALYPITNEDADGSFEVAWTDVDRAAYYVLEQATKSDFADAVPKYTGASTSTGIVGLAPGTYYYRVQAVNATGSSAWSNPESVSVTRCLSAPVLLEIENDDGDGSYVVDWTGVDTALSYSLQEDTDPSFPDPALYVVSTTSKSITGQSIGTYYYRVKAAHETCESDWSGPQVVAVTIEAPIPLPGTWYGDTSWFEDVQFYVSSDSGSVSDVRLVLHGDCGIVTDPGPVPIENGHFSFGWFWGDFTADDEAEGSYTVMGESPNCGFMIETGSWDASR